MLREARALVHAARQAEGETRTWADSGMSPQERAQLEDAYRRLDAKRQRMPFHAGEVHLVNLTALVYSDFDFPRALTFVVNWGRDNDTTAAVTGAILGAYWGAGQLPAKWVGRSLEENRALGIDLEVLAERLTTAIVERRPA
jgi:ADP-ribosylglycohydrolase